MLSSSTSMPIVVIFERHWDEAPKQTLKSLIPMLAQEGYDTLCFEAPQNLNESEIMASFNQNIEFDSNLSSQADEYLRRVGVTSKLSDIGFGKLANLMRLYVSSKKYNKVAEKIKNLPASLLLKDIFKDAQRLSISINGVDIDHTDFGNILSLDLLERSVSIEKNEDYRIKTITNNLIKLRNKRGGVVFVCGALHADNLIAKLKEKNIQDVLYYFPHSAKQFDDNIDDIKIIIADGILKDHSYRLLNEKDAKSLNEKIIKEIKSSNTQYRKEVEGGNSHSEFLSEVFKANVQAFERPGYYVDALLDTNQSVDVKNITEKLQEANIQFHQTSLDGHTYLVIPEVNTREVAENIRRLK